METLAIIRLALGKENKSRTAGSPNSPRLKKDEIGEDRSQEHVHQGDGSQRICLESSNSQFSILL
jgi:hypothetical protein